MAAGIIPGFRPAISDEAAPISLIQEAYSTLYNKFAKRKYSMTLMEPAKFSPQNSAPLYHSINYATFTQNHMDASKKKSQIAVLDEIRIITQLYCNDILENKKNIQSLYDIVKNFVFNYYHSSPENYPKIKDAQLLTDDPRFIPLKGCEFPSNAAFLKGCIKISLSDSF